jgi:hypothetical protein
MPAALAAFTALSLTAEVQKPGAAAPAKESKDPKIAKQKDIVHLLKVLGWPAGNAEAARKQLQTAAKDPKYSNFPAAYWKDYESAATPEAFEKILVPLFEKAYTHDEIKTLLKFMGSPEFKFFAEKNPDVKVKKEAFEGFSKYMTEVGGKLREKHGVKVGAPVKK